MARDDDARSRARVYDEDDDDDYSSEEEDRGIREPPPPLQYSSGSEGGEYDSSHKVFKVKNSEGKWTKTMMPVPAHERPFVAPKQGAGSNKAPVSEKANKDEGDALLWKLFAGYQSRLTDADQLGAVERMRWEALESAGTMPPGFISWFDDQIRQGRSVPRAVAVRRLPPGFPEFCHWVAEGYYDPSANLLKPGFYAMAVQHVDKVKARQESNSAAQRQQPVSGAGGAGQAGSGADSSKSQRETRHSGRRNGNEGLAEKVQSALAGLETVPDAEGEAFTGHKLASGRAILAGSRAEDRVHKASAAAAAAAAAAAGREFSDANGLEGIRVDTADLPESTAGLLERFTRARAYRSRAARQFTLFEEEVEKVCARAALIEARYRALVAETRGKELPLEEAVASATPLVTQARTLLNTGGAAKALEGFTDAIKLLETHVLSSRVGDDPPVVSRAREALGVALCNRSVANFMVGNFFSGKEDAKTATELWPTKTSREHLDRCTTFVESQGWEIPRPDWDTYALPP